MRKIRVLWPTASALALVLAAGCASLGGGGDEPKERAPVWVQTDEPNLIPAGTELAIRVDQEIDSKSQVEGKTFNGALAQDIRSHGGAIMVPQGSPVALTVVKKSTNGGAFDTPELSLAVQSITANGRRYTVSSETSAQKGDEGFGVNERTGIYTGGGAVLGTVLGAAIGGKEGAVVGGVLGAGAGAAAQVLTQGKEVHVPAGTVINFRLDQPWHLVPASNQPQQPQPNNIPVS